MIIEAEKEKIVNINVLFSNSATILRNPPLKLSFQILLTKEKMTHPTILVVKLI
jgi:hypothetical protein